MAQFRCTLTGNRGTTSRLGSAKTCLQAKVNGWNAGVDVDAFVFSDGHDFFEIYKTGGSYAKSSRVLLGTVHDDQFFPADPDK